MELWWPQSAWLSPGAAMFLFFNVLVGAVVVMSRNQRGDHGRRLCRSASSMVLDRLRSFSSKFSAHPAAECYYHTIPEAGELLVGVPAPEQAVLEPATAGPPSVPAATVPESEHKCAGLEERNVQGQKHQAPAETSPPAASAAGEPITAMAEGAGKEQPVKEAPESSCKQRARACRREAEEVLEGKAELNARAELFIHQFREDLKLQRLNSIILHPRAPALRRSSTAAAGVARRRSFTITKKEWRKYTGTQLFRTVRNNFPWIKWNNTATDQNS